MSAWNSLDNPFITSNNFTAFMKHYLFFWVLIKLVYYTIVYPLLLCMNYYTQNYRTKPQSHVHHQPVVHLSCGFIAYHYTTVLLVQGTCYNHSYDIKSTNNCLYYYMSVAHSS